MITFLLKGVNDYLAKVSKLGALHITLSSAPPEENSQIFPFRSHLSMDGLGITTDMRVNGATTNQTFSIKANSDEDIYVKGIMFTLADAAANFNTFGNLTSLTNGCLFRWVTPTREVALHPAIKSNFDLVQVCLFNPSFGTGADAFRGVNVVGTSEAYCPVFDFTNIMPYGLKLGKGTQDRVEFIIKDNLSVGLDRFDAVAYGFTKED